MHRIVSRLHVILYILFILGSSTLRSQVHISERVAIAPSGDTTHGAQNQLIDKWKALTKNAKRAEKVKGSSQEKNKLSALIGLPASGNVTVTVLDGASATIIDLVLRSPTQETIVKDANNHHGFVWEGTGFPSGTTLDFGIWWYGYYGMSGWEYSCDISQVDDSTYMLGFEDTGAPPINVDLIVQVVLGGIPSSPPVDHFDVTLLPDTIHQVDVSTLRVRAKDALNNDIFLQPNTQLKITADDGGTYGHVGENEVPGEVFSYRDAYNGTVVYNADGDVPDNVQKVMIRVEKADDPGKNGTGNLYIAPLDHFEIHPKTGTIHHAEETAIFVQGKDANNQGLQYYGGNVQISASPSGYGHLTYVIPSAIASPKDKIVKPKSLSATSGKGKASSSLESVKPTGSNSLAADDPPLEVDYWTASHGMVFYTADGAAPVGDITITLTVSAVDKPGATGTGSLLLTRKSFDILLGETQYFYAVKDPDHSDRLTIKEFSTPKNGNTNVLFEDPQVVEGDKLGVYWEYKDADGNDLTNTTPGCIRLIGRYWKPDQKYSVRLIAKLANGSRADTINVEVKRPGKLGKSYNGTVKDVFGHDVNLNDMIFKYAGENGIPPQIIKGQMQRESAFKPAYRYEPFVDVDGQSEFSNRKYDRFRIQSRDNVGTVPIPSDHTNSSPHYLGFQGTVWNFLYNNSVTVNPRASKNNYPMFNTSGKLLWYETPARGWLANFLYVFFQTLDSDKATNEANDWLRNRYHLGQMKETAQTRLAPSYGILQSLYGTATKYRKYPIDDEHSPEKLNENDNAMKYSIEFLSSIRDNYVSTFQNKDGQWKDGYESAFRYILNKYNGSVRDNPYGNEVIEYSKKFVPVK